LCKIPMWFKLKRRKKYDFDDKSSANDLENSCEIQPKSNK